MAFVNEFILEEEKYRFQDWKEALSGFPFIPWKWTIDRERDVFLVGLGGGGGRVEIPEFFALSWHGEVIEFRGYEQVNGTKEEGIEISWKMLLDPQMLETRIPGSVDLLKEAICAYGQTYKNENVKNVHIEFVRRTLRC